MEGQEATLLISLESQITHRNLCAYIEVSRQTLQEERKLCLDSFCQFKSQFPQIIMMGLAGLLLSFCYEV